MSNKRIKIAEETVAIQNQGFYVAPSGNRVDIEFDQREAEKSTLISPQEGKALIEGLKFLNGTTIAPCRVLNESVVKTILDETPAPVPVAALNFASAKHPGGGFLKGSLAQEEAMAYSSGLYNCLKHQKGYYDVNRADMSAMYTDTAIYAKDVVFFRDENYQLVEHPDKCNILTLPAVNMGYVKEKGKNLTIAENTMKNRMRLALAIFAAKQDKIIILGAYGCGVFQNDPIKVAQWWKELLRDEGYGQFFSQIIFSVLDKKGGENIRPFEAIFGGGSH